MSMFHELMMRKKEQIMYATIKGTLTENNGVFSGFSASNYLALQQSFTLTPTTKAEFVVRVSNTTFDGSSSFLGMIGSYSINFRFNTGKKLVLYLGNGSSWVVNGLEGTTVFQENNFYYAKLVFDNGVITIYSSNSGKIWTQEATTTVSFTYTYNLIIGRAKNDSSYQKGSIDLNNSYIKLGSTKYKLQAVVGYKIVGSPTITDGVVSGFVKNTNYLNINNMPFSSNVWEIVIRANHTSGNTTLIATNNDGRNGLLVLFGNKQITVYLKRDGADQTLITASVEGLTDNNFHYMKLQRQYNDLILSYSEDGINYSVLNTVQPQSFIPNSNICLGGGSYWSTVGFGGSIDMNETLIKINNKLWFNGQEG